MIVFDVYLPDVNMSPLLEPNVDIATQSGINQ